MKRCWQTQLLALSAIYTVLTHSERLLKDEMQVVDDEDTSILEHEQRFVDSESGLLTDRQPPKA